MVVPKFAGGGLKAQISDEQTPLNMEVLDERDR
jgi:hypothetical protein